MFLYIPAVIWNCHLSLWLIRICDVVFVFSTFIICMYSLDVFLFSTIFITFLTFTLTKLFFRSTKQGYVGGLLIFKGLLLSYIFVFFCSILLTPFALQGYYWYRYACIISLVFLLHYVIEWVCILFSTYYLPHLFIRLSTIGVFLA